MSPSKTPTFSGRIHLPVIDIPEDDYEIAFGTSSDSEIVSDCPKSVPDELLITSASELEEDNATTMDIYNHLTELRLDSIETCINDNQVQSDCSHIGKMN